MRRQYTRECPALVEACRPRMPKMRANRWGYDWVPQGKKWEAASDPMEQAHDAVGQAAEGRPVVNAAAAA